MGEMAVARMSCCQREWGCEKEEEEEEKQKRKKKKN